MNANKRILPLLALSGVLAVAAWLVSRPPRVNPLAEARRDTLTLRDGRLYRQGDSTPFTGLMTEFHENGTVLSRSSVSNGLLEGLSEGWHTNGQIQVREHFAAGVSNGPRLKWRPNGRILSQANVLQGRIEGIFRRWHEDGSVAEEIPMKAGQPDGLARSYYAGGCLKAEARLREGQVIEQHFWKDGEHPARVLAQSQSPLATGN